jgi:DNA-binding NarL/FixJ family response regulator
MACMRDAYEVPVRRVDADEAWASLWEGEWTVVDHTRDPPLHSMTCARAPSGPTRPLLARDEIELATGRARGVTLKAIAADSGRSMTAVSNLFTRVRRRLMLRSDAQFVLFFGGAEREDVVPPPAGLKATLERYGPGERLSLRYPWPSWRLPPTLSDAERTVVLDLVDGASRRDIALARGTSERTVANQMASIFRKLRVGSRVELLAALRPAPGNDGPTTMAGPSPPGLVPIGSGSGAGRSSPLRTDRPRPSVRIAVPASCSA